jgi:hypothetical protein
MPNSYGFLSTLGLYSEEVGIKNFSKHEDSLET